jgi:hypothetical protein
MAHAYTTKRGKNKISKLGVRKDQQQNQERSLKSGPDLAAFLYDGPKEASGIAVGRIGNNSVNTARLENVKARLQKSLLERCCNPDCSEKHKEETASENGNNNLLECSGCHRSRYCSKDCQLNHWPIHKVKCKEIRKNLAQQAEEKQQVLRQALQGLNVSDTASTNHVPTSVFSKVESDIKDGDASGDSPAEPLNSTASGDEESVPGKFANAEIDD